MKLEVDIKPSAPCRARQHAGLIFSGKWPADHQKIWTFSTKGPRQIHERVWYGSEICLQAIWAEICDHVLDTLGKSLEDGSKWRDLGPDNIKKGELCPFENKGDNDIEIGSVIQWQFPGIEAEDGFFLHSSQNMRDWLTRFQESFHDLEITGNAYLQGAEALYPPGRRTRRDKDVFL